MALVLASPQDVRDMRVRVDGFARMIGDSSEYSTTRVAGMRAALDWLDGTTAVRPVSGGLAAPDRDEVHREAERAGEAERDRGAYAGAVLETLYWSLGRTEIVL